MKIVMVNYWSDANKGDCSMALGTIAAFRRVAPDASFTIVPAFWRGDPRFAEACRHLCTLVQNLRVIPTVLPLVDIQERSWPLPGIVAGAFRRGLWLSHLAGSLIRLLRPRGEEYFQAIAEADLVLSSPGSYFFVIRPGLRAALERLGGGFYAHAYPLLVARRLGRPYALYAQSIGPFQGSRLLGRATRWLIDRATYTTVRETRSKDELVRFGVRPELVRVQPDASFAMTPSTPDRIARILNRHALSGIAFMAVTVRPWRQDGAEAYQRYISAMAQALDRILDDGLVRRIALVIMCTFHGPDELDHEAAVRLLKQMRRRDAVTMIEEDLSPPDICALLGQAKFVISTRAHALNFAAIGGTPSIGISYWGFKTWGFMEALGLSEFVLEMKGLTSEQILGAVSRLTTRRTELAETVRTRVANLREDALRVPFEVLRAAGVHVH